MKRLFSLVLLAALIGLAGCADPVPSPELTIRVTDVPAYFDSSTGISFIILPVGSTTVLAECAGTIQSGVFTSSKALDVVDGSNWVGDSAEEYRCVVYFYYNGSGWTGSFADTFPGGPGEKEIVAQASEFD